jgi:outer membrane protein TolC
MREARAPGIVAVAVGAVCVAALVGHADGHADADGTTASPTGTEIERVTLAEALALARARNSDALVAAAEVRRAAALVAEVRAASLPTLAPNFTYTRIDAARNFMGMNIQSADQLFVAGGLSVPLIAAPRWADWAHAIDNRKNAALNRDDVERRVAIAVAHAYLEVIVQRRVIDANVNARDTAKAHAAYADQQYAGGAVNRLDAARAGQQWHTAEAQVSDSLVALATAQEALGVLVAGDRPVDASETPVFPLPASGEHPEQLRADILAQLMRREAAHHLVRDSWTDYMPTLVGTFDPQLSDPATIFQPSFAWQAQLVLVLPIFEGGLRYGQLHERRALLDQASIGVDELIRQTRADIRRGVDAAWRARDRVRESDLAAKLAREALQIANLRYHEGATTNIDVIDAERQARDTDLAAAAAEDNERQVRLDLLAATGQFP